MIAQELPETNYLIGDQFEILIPSEDQPRYFVAHRVDNLFGVVYYHKKDGTEESIGVSGIRKFENTTDEIFTDDFLNEIGFDRVHCGGFPEYGRAIDKRTRGMTVLAWNNRGASCTYFGEPLEKNTHLGIRKDGDTRYVFNGYVFNQDDVRRLLHLTW
jgi:hypothetical protein